MARINRGGMQFPICFMPSSNSPANTNASDNDANLLNSGNENRRHSDQRIALALKYGEMLRHEYEPLTIKGSESPAFEMKDFAFTESWPV
jgi:hypothetical protein